MIIEICARCKIYNACNVVLYCENIMIKYNGLYFIIRFEKNKIKRTFIFFAYIEKNLFDN